MELEEAINRLKQLIEIRKSRCRFIDFDTCICGTKDIETILQELENSVSKKKIEDKIEELENCKMDIVQSSIHNANEKIKMLDRNMIKREILQELLEDK